MSVSERRAEPWVAVGYTSLAAKKTPRAVYFAQKVPHYNNVIYFRMPDEDSENTDRSLQCASSVV